MKSIEVASTFFGTMGTPDGFSCRCLADEFNRAQSLKYFGPYGKTVILLMLAGY